MAFLQTHSMAAVGFEAAVFRCSDVWRLLAWPEASSTPQICPDQLVPEGGYCPSYQPADGAKERP